MMKGRTTNNVQANRNTKNGKSGQKTQKTDGGKRSSEQEKLEALETKEETDVSVIVNEVTTPSQLSEVNDTVNDDHNAEITENEENGLAYNDSEEEKKEESEDFEALAHEKRLRKLRKVSMLIRQWKFRMMLRMVVHAVEVSKNETGYVKEKSEKDEEKEEASKQNIEDLETRIENLEEELREVAALEISLYSVVPDHSSSAHKLHTPARRISRLYLHACKHWSQRKLATVVRNTVSGLILAAKSCGNDVARLTFWLSNIVVLREIISQACGKTSVASQFTKTSESNGKEHTGSGKLRRKNNQCTNQSNGFKQVSEDWQETETFTTALIKVEFRIFSRIVECIWWQVFTPHMQSRITNENLMAPALKDHEKRGNSISLWENAFKVALSRLCPMQRAGHKCGCLPILAKVVMEKCIARVDVAMSNAILRESEHQIPTDPVSDPILDSNVLPIPSGDLSFGSGAQLKNAVQNQKT